MARARGTLGEAFLAALQADFAENGKAAIAAVRVEKPFDYLKVITALMPKQVEVREGAFDGIGDEELVELVRAAKAALGK